MRCADAEAEPLTHESGPRVGQPYLIGGVSTINFCVARHPPIIPISECGPCGIRRCCESPLLWRVLNAS